ncbi:HK97-gp10 family putative phage morphogenesis protein [Hymenobacter sp. APR13]|uniref:HK97-gp10 family putative phage morphogenesis protein n=1 Tax=Hymenobacter sp. APR13 TaxID=1356852 RepID=UPI0009006CAF|nr:HK97-gp10 family putative phage morphogenesis protein [Hymenobacter sp. APR13]
MGISVKLQGADNLKTKLQAYLISTPKRVQIAVDTYGYEVESTAKQLVRVDTGLLRSSISYQRDGSFKGEVTVNAAYAKYIEFGTRKMPAYPFLNPAVQQHRAAFLANLKQAVKFKI